LPQTFQVAVYPGDGIGPEVIAQAVKVLDAAQQAEGNFALQYTTIPWGIEYWKQHGCVAPADMLDVLRPFDAILLGAVGWPDLQPDHVTLAPLVTIRQAFNQYACMRPVKLLPGVSCPLVGKSPDDIDFVVIRENSEGEYLNSGARVKVGQPDEFALQTAVHTRRGIERVLRFGFEMAQQRRHHLTMITKSNAMRYSYVLWDETLEQVRSDYPDVTAQRQHADAAAMNFVRCPESFDVVVASNLFGDILTDLGGVIAGGLGLAPSTNTNPEREFPSMFEPVHGSAPDITGQGIANPVAAILSAAMMLDWLGLPTATGRIRAAVEGALLAGHGTPDLGGSMSTNQMGDVILASL
jgi:tartrate dehydrogenase/decarboxylase/D-malate dehydrogenase